MALVPPPADVSRYPTRNLPEGSSLFRVHRDDRAAWHFDDSLSGRFNLDAPHGTCYLAEQAEAALLEALGRIEPLTSTVVRTRRLMEVRTDRPLRLADTTRKGAGAWHTLEIATDVAPGYAITRRWARAWHAASFDGVRYWCRTGTGKQLRSVALFSRQGVAAPGAWPPGVSREIAEDDLVRVATHGLRYTAPP